MSAEPKSLVAKLAEVMAEVHRVPKSGRNEFHKYDYATERDIVEAVRGALSDRGIVLVPSVLSVARHTPPAPAGKEPGDIVSLVVRFTFLDGSDDKVEFDIASEGQDKGDKATYKALTGATKYALLKFFLIPTGDDPENDGPAKAPRKPAWQTKGELRRTPEELAAIAQEPPASGPVETLVPPPFQADPLSEALAIFKRRAGWAYERGLLEFGSEAARRRWLSDELGRKITKRDDVSLAEWLTLNSKLLAMLQRGHDELLQSGGKVGDDAPGSVRGESVAGATGEPPPPITYEAWLAAPEPPLSAERIAVSAAEGPPSKIEMDAIRRAWHGAIARAAAADVSVGPVHLSMAKGTTAMASGYRTLLLEQLLRQDIPDKATVTKADWRTAIASLNALVDAENINQGTRR